MESIGKTTFSFISLNSTVTCKATSEKSCKSWVKKLIKLNSTFGISAEFSYIPEEITKNIIKKRCKLSKNAIFSTDNQFKGGEISDIVQFVVSHEQEPRSG